MKNLEIIILSVLIAIMGIPAHGMEQQQMINPAAIKFSDPYQSLSELELLYGGTVIGHISYSDKLHGNGIERIGFMPHCLKNDSLNLRSVKAHYAALFITHSKTDCSHVSFHDLSTSDYNPVPATINIKDLKLGAYRPISIRRYIIYDNEQVGEIYYRYELTANGVRSITTFNVCEKMRNKGIGTHAMLLFMKESKMHGVRSLRLESRDQAKPLYQRLKFTFEKPESNFMVRDLSDIELQSSDSKIQ